MYLKRAPASPGRAVLRCGMSLGPSAAGGSPTSATLSLFNELQVKYFFCRNKIQYFSTFQWKTRSSFGKNCSPWNFFLRINFHYSWFFEGFVVKEAFKNFFFVWKFALQNQRDSQQHTIIIRNNCVGSLLYPGYSAGNMKNKSEKRKCLLKSRAGLSQTRTDYLIEWFHGQTDKSTSRQINLRLTRPSFLDTRKHNQWCLPPKP